jgi:hypothetical protein
MSDCCTDLLEKLDEILTALGPIGADVGNLDENVALMLSDWPTALSAWLCACEQATKANTPSRVNIIWPATEPPPAYITYDNSDADQTFDPEVSEDACLLAQAWYAAGFEFVTERVLPAFRFGWDALQQALVAAITLATGGAGIPVAFGVFVTAQLVQELLDLAYDATESDLWNWLVSNKEELVCALYAELLAGGSTKTIWETVWSDQIENNPDLSDGEQLLLRVSFGAIAAATAKVAKEEDTTWYQSVVTPGYCAVCESAPVTWTYTFPPCPGVWDGVDFCWNGRMCLNHGEATWRIEYLPPPLSGTWDTCKLETWYLSSKPAGWTVGKIWAQYWNGSGWSDITPACSQVTTQPSMTQNYTECTFGGLSEPGGRNVQFQCWGQPGLYDAEPYPWEVQQIRVTFSQTT